MTTPHLRKSIDRSPLRLGFLRIPVALTLACFALLPTGQAVVPPPDGGYPAANTAEGQSALFSLTSGGYNTAVGYSSLWRNTVGSFNTAIGVGALYANTADQNTATGVGALLNNTIGNNNTANGAFALFSSTTGIQNTAIGSGALFSNSTTGNISGDDNTAVGYQALYSNVFNSANTAEGAYALFSNFSGTSNTANGFNALYYNTTGNFNAANGGNVLLSNTTGSNNTADGFQALSFNTSGSKNIALGARAGGNITTVDNVICIGYDIAGGNVSNTTWIGNVYGVTTQSGTTAPVVVSADGQLGTVASSEQFKKDIATMDKTSEAIMSLRPVTFHYKSDTKGTPQFGLIAEDVVKVNPALVLPDKEGKPYTVRYDAVNAMLLNEFLKEHHKVEEQQATISQLNKDFRATVAQLTTRLDEQTAQIQKVSAELEASKPAPQVVNNQ